MKTYRIETNRLVIRCYAPADAKKLLSAITESLEHLKPWMPWAAQEPSSLKAKRDLLKKFREEFESGIDYTFGIFNKKEDRVLGGTGLHTRLGENEREIGYWIHAEFLNQGLATEAAGALTKVGFEYEKLERIEIHCDPLNVRSRKVPEKLGYTLVKVIRNKPFPATGGTRDTMIWEINRETYPKSPGSKFELTVFNKIGQEIK
ncbi:GNAT family N-acetyltransferase [Robiginitalea sp. IMCC43444]|uniref:GNAT family N-acetyltransferase n=1 Tax=Robiginitalea sp. IMCC43444 TaxID=3459121 RepID=UPI004041ED02